jgi:hypothetical protein
LSQSGSSPCAAPIASAAWRTSGAGEAALVVGQCHCRPAHDEQLRVNPGRCEPVGEFLEQGEDALGVQLGAVLAHARFSDSPVMKMPR